MKLSKNTPVCVFQGDVMEKLHWGFVQFPWLYKLDDGSIIVSIHCEDDAPHIISDEGIDLKSKKYFKSSDQGKTWVKADIEDIRRIGYKTPNGDVIKLEPFPPKNIFGVKAPTNFGNYRIPTDDLEIKKSEDPSVLPFPVAMEHSVFGNHDNLYYVDTLPDGLRDDGVVVKRLKKGADRAVKYTAPLDWKYRITKVYDPKIVYDSFDGDETLFLVSCGVYCETPIKIGPDGKSLWCATYKPGADPKTGVYSGKSGAYILRSDDNGESWRCVSYIRYEGDAEKDHLAYLREGVSEPSIEFMDDGSMLCLLRTCGVFGGTTEWGPTYLCRSLDGGESWSKPEFFADRGALPQLLKLDCGVTLAVVTRPGIYVYASDDNGYTWNTKLEIMEDTDRSVLANEVPERANFWQYAGSCCNCTIVPIAPNKALLSYSDFYYPDETGLKRKSILTVEITVEK